jgi:hypothetical protein
MKDAESLAARKGVLPDAIWVRIPLLRRRGTYIKRTSLERFSLESAMCFLPRFPSTIVLATAVLGTVLLLSCGEDQSGVLVQRGS